MRRLLKDFDELFDLTYQVGDRPLGEWLEQMISGLEEPSQEWGTTGACVLGPVFHEIEDGFGLTGAGEV